MFPDLVVFRRQYATIEPIAALSVTLTTLSAATILGAQNGGSGMSEWTSDVAEWYAEKYGEYATNRLAIESLEFPPDANIVDIGCGTGSALRHAARRTSNGRLVGIDPVPRMLEIARERARAVAMQDRIEFLLGSAEAVPVDDSFADVVLAFDSFDHWPDKLKGLQEVRRILKPSGRFVVVKDVDSGPGDDFPQAALKAGFGLDDERLREEDGVTFKTWICSLRTSQ